jgi:hypothetical protein
LLSSGIDNSNAKVDDFSRTRQTRDINGRIVKKECVLRELIAKFKEPYEKLHSPPMPEQLLESHGKDKRHSIGWLRGI